MYDLVLYNGKIYPMSEEGLSYSYMAIKNGVIKMLGNNFDQKTITSENFIDLEGASILPSFSDAHVHLVQTGLNYLGLNLSDLRTIDEILERIAEKCQKTPAGKLIRGIHFDITNVEERRFPTRKELDEVSPNHPVWINSIEYHMSAVNSMALHLVNLPYFIDGIARDERNLPKGFLSGKASAFFRNRMFENISDRDRMIGVSKAVNYAISKGITSIHAMEGGYTFHDKDVEFILKNQEQLPIDIHLFYQSYDVDKIIENGLKRIGGDIFVDGSFGSKTAAVTKNYLGTSGNGKLYFTDEELDYFVKYALENNLQISLHTIGDRAIAQALRSFKKYIKTEAHKALRHRLEHFELPREAHLDLAKELNIDICVQPVFEHLWGHPGEMYEKRLGERYKETNKFSHYLEKGLRLIGGSDSDVTELNPLLGIHTAVNHPKKISSISVYEAVRMFTYNSQYSVFKEDVKGTLEANKIADFIVLDQDLFEIDSLSIKETNVLKTFKDGKCIYSRGDQFE